jgi:hypothetical protein
VELSDILDLIKNTFTGLRISRFFLSLRTSALSSFYSTISSITTGLYRQLELKSFFDYLNIDLYNERIAEFSAETG